jgi:hypothetical protein
MKFRLAKISDLKAIVNIHYGIRDTYDVGIFAQIGKSFLSRYYKIIMNEKNSIILCAYDEDGMIHGFCSATLDVEAQFEFLMRHKISLALSAIGSILRKPSLIKPLLERYNSLRKNQESKFINLKGSRSEYWAWAASSKDTFSSLEMHERLLGLLNILGVVDLFFEVDVENKRVFRFHKYNGAEVVETLTLPDGRVRALMKYNLLNRNSRVKNLF